MSNGMFDGITQGLIIGLMFFVLVSLYGLGKKIERLETKIDKITEEVRK